MDVEDVRIVDGLIFGYLSRRQTLRALCNEAPYLRDARSRFQSGGDVFIQVNDQLHDKNLEEIVSAFSSVGRFDVTPELIDFGIRLRDLTNEFSTMTALRGRSIRFLISRTLPSILFYWHPKYLLYSSHTSQRFNGSSWLGGVSRCKSATVEGPISPGEPPKLRSSPALPSGSPARSKPIPGTTTVLVPN
ncbi:unnamed protein product [Angiostrongylus costaricensis]|uniref:LisH domain-containing protein n=1 Tax=Angiostrongylus costaricensis TaxID=334426 RepID=A0A0R3PGB8_ANGCS|nr:unnamed protein product [Angiostrongylus costaricensis]